MIFSSRNVTIFLMAIATAVVFGLGYAHQNANTYLIEGLAQIDPNALARDWFTRGTNHYHHNFSYLLMAIHALGLPLGLTLVCMDVAVKLLSFIGLYKIIESLTERFPIIVFAGALFLVLLDLTISVAYSYLFTVGLQPSSFGTLFTIWGILFFIRGRYPASGFAVAVGGYLHTNFLLLGFVYLGLAHLFLGRKEFITRCFKQFTPMLLSFALIIPFLLEMMTARDGEYATYIFQHIRSPHHYVPMTFLGDFIHFYAWTALGAIGLYLLQTQHKYKRRATALFTALILSVTVATLLTTVVFIPKVSQLYFWRMAPFIVVLSQIFFLCGLLNHMAAPKTSPRAHIVITLATLLALSALLRHYFLMHSPKAYVFVPFFLVSSLMLIPKRTPQKPRINPELISWAVLFLFVSLTGYRYAVSFYPCSSYLNGFPGKAESELTNWAKQTNTDSIFLIPPDLENFRLQSRRAVVVDWKSTPIDPEGLIQWYERIRNVAGVPNPKSLKEAMDGYNGMDMSRLSKLRAQYDADFAIFDSVNPPQLDNLPVVFSNDGFIVVSIDGLNQP